MEKTLAEVDWVVVKLRQDIGYSGVCIQPRTHKPGRLLPPASVLDANMCRNRCSCFDVPVLAESQTSEASINNIEESVLRRMDMICLALDDFEQVRG